MRSCRRLDRRHPPSRPRLRRLLSRHRIMASIGVALLTCALQGFVFLIVVFPTNVSGFLRPRLQQSWFPLPTSPAANHIYDSYLYSKQHGVDDSGNLENQSSGRASRSSPSSNLKRNQRSKGRRRDQDPKRNKSYKETKRKQEHQSSAHTRNGKTDRRRHNKVSDTEINSLTSTTPAAMEFNRWLSQSFRVGNLTAEEAEQELLQRVEAYVQNSRDAGRTSNQGSQTFDSISFNIILKAWSREQSLTAARRADALLEILHKRSSSTMPWLQADTYSYGSVLHAYAKSNGRRASALRADELLMQMERRLSQKQISTTDVCHNAVMDCWSVSGVADAGRRAGAILSRLEEYQKKQDGKIYGPRPTRISYNTCMKAYARSKPPDGPVEAHRILNRMKALGGDLSPDKISYSICIDAYCRSGDTNNQYHNWTWAATQSEALLKEMEDASETTNNGSSSNLRPDVVAYTSVLVCYAKAGIDYRLAMDLISRMEKFAGQTPNTTFLNTLLHLFAKTGKSKHAEALLRTMQKSQMEDKISYTSVISAHANAIDAPVNATRAVELLSELEDLYNNTKDERYLPSTKTFASVFNAMAKSESQKTRLQIPKPDDEEDVLDQIDALLQRLHSLYSLTNDPDLRINSVVYSQLFQILSNTAPNMGRHSSIAVAKRAMELLKEMKAQQVTNPLVRPDAATYAYFVNAITKSRVRNAAEVATQILADVEKGYEAGDDGLKPTKLLYSAVMQAYAKSSSARGAELAEQLLKRTQDLYQTKGRLYAKPTTLYFNAVMDAHARNPTGGREAALRCEALLVELETKARARDDKELTPTTRSYNAVLLAFMNSNDPDAPQRAEALLKRMNERYRNGDENCRPDRVTMNSIISVWARCNYQYDKAAQRAEQFLNFMEGLYETVGDQSLKPDAYSYNSVIDAYAKQQQYHSNNGLSNSTTAVLRAEHLYQKMKELCRAGDNSLCPDSITLTSLRHAWIHCTHPDSSIKVQEYSNMISDLRQQQKRRQRMDPLFSPTPPANSISAPDTVALVDRPYAANATQTVRSVALGVLDEFLP